MTIAVRGARTILAAALALGLIGTAAAVALTSVAAADPAATTQRVQIDTKYPGNTFVLTPLRAGEIERDSGSHGCLRVPSKREIVRDGEQAWTWGCPQWRFVGMHGELVLRSRFTWVEAGGSYNVAMGTWKVVSGTGQYARLAGNGRSARVGTPGMERARYQGVLRAG